MARGRAIQATLDTPANREHMWLREVEREKTVQNNQAVLVRLGLGQRLVPPRSVAPPPSAKAMGKRPAPRPSPAPTRELRKKDVSTDTRAEGRESSEQSSDESSEQSGEEFSPSEASSDDERRRGGSSGKVARVTLTGARQMRASDAPVPLQSQTVQLPSAQKRAAAKADAAVPDGPRPCVAHRRAVPRRGAR